MAIDPEELLPRKKQPDIVLGEDIARALGARTRKAHRGAGIRNRALPRRHSRARRDKVGPPPRSSNVKMRPSRLIRTGAHRVRTTIPLVLCAHRGGIRLARRRAVDSFHRA
ncbi:MAG: hypothetical protein WDN03_01745 [Rhizomicrobium sp.]